MKTKVLSIIYLLWMLYYNMQLYSQDSEIDHKVTKHLNAYLNDFQQGILNEDVSKFSTYYAHDMRLMPAFSKTVKGRVHVDLYYKAFFTRFDVMTYDRKMIEILDLGSQIIVLGTFSMKLTFISSKEETELKGKYINIWKKDKKGLILSTDIWNYDHHTELTDHLRFENVPGILMATQPHLAYDTDIRYEIAALNQFMETVIAEHDHTSWSGIYAEDGVFMYSYESILKGRKELDPFIERHMKELPIFEKLDVRNDQIDDLGNYVIEYASHIANWREGHHSGVSTGKGIRIWKRQHNCSLKIYRQIATYD